MSKKSKLFAGQESWEIAVPAGVDPETGEIDTAFLPNTPQSIAVAPKKQTGRCYESHPQLQLGGGVFIGGSCGTPITDDANVYIGFERFMHVQVFALDKPRPEYICYPITDMCAPSNSITFKALIKYAKEALAKGLTVHAGCIGGHGRTGTFLAALVKEVNGTEDAITWVRENYCKKAVESSDQVEFLHKHFGIKKVAGHKAWGGTPAAHNGKVAHSSWPYSGSKELSSVPKSGAFFAGSEEIYTCVPSKKSIFSAGIL